MTSGRGGEDKYWLKYVSRIAVVDCIII